MTDGQTVNPQSVMQSAFGLEMHGIYQRALSEAGYKATGSGTCYTTAADCPLRNTSSTPRLCRRAIRRYGSADTFTSPLKR